MAGSKQRAMRNKRQATRREVPRLSSRQKVGPTSRNAVSTARSRVERPSDLNIATCRRTASSAGAACPKIDFCSMNCNRERTAQWRARSDFRSSPAISSGWKQKSTAEPRKNPRQPETTTQPRKTRRAPGGNRARDHPLQRRTQDH